MKKVGILGGGQLGRMLLQAAVNYPAETFLMEANQDCPASHLCHHFTLGDKTDFTDVYNFGKNLDAITIEIEDVNDDALAQLEKEGVKVYPSPSALKIIKNKILQKTFYKENEIPSAPFVVTDQKYELNHHEHLIPGVHKMATGGYDGRGVQLIETPSAINSGFDGPAVFEKKIQIVKELSIIVGCNDKLETVMYSPVHMMFSESLNQLDFQISPADILQKHLWRAEAIAQKVITNLKSPGIFAVEMFIDRDENIWVNETAPRVHNSGHHTIEANYSSQFDMLWRIMLDYPLGNPDAILPAAMVNLVGEPGFSGKAVYDGLNEVLAMENVFVHIYGKKETRPGRKMGHVTILSHERQELIHRCGIVKRTLKVLSDN